MYKKYLFKTIYFLFQPLLSAVLIVAFAQEPYGQ